MKTLINRIDFISYRREVSHVIWCKNTIIFVLLLCFVILLPTLFPPVRLEDFLILSVIVAYLLTNHKIYFPSKLIIFSLILSITFIFSVISGFVITDVPISIRDLSFIGLILKYLALFILIGSLGVSWNITVRDLLVLISWVGLFSAAVAIAQFFNFASINTWLTPLYISQGFYLDKLVSSETLRRTIGTSFNPNHYAYLLIFPLISTMLLVLAYRKYRYLILNFIMLVALVTTLSRTGVVIALLVLIIVYFLWSFKRKHYLGPAIFVVGAILAMGYLLFSDVGNDIAFFQRFSKTELNLSGENSIGVRLSRWINVLQWFEHNPEAWWFGVGPQKSLLDPTFIDSQYFSLLKKSGIVGLILIVVIEIYVLVIAFKVFIRSSEIEKICISIYVLGIIIALLVAQITIEIINDTQAIGLTVILLGFFFSKKKEWRMTRKRAAVVITSSKNEYK